MTKQEFIQHFILNAVRAGKNLDNNFIYWAEFHWNQIQNVAGIKEEDDA